MKKITLVFVQFFFFEFAFSQAPLVLFNPIEYNGGLTGNTGYARISMPYTVYSKYDNLTNNDMGNRGWNFIHSSSFDCLSKKLKGGIGISVSYGQFEGNLVLKSSRTIYTQSGNSSISNTYDYYTNQYLKVNIQRLGLVYAPKFIIKQKVAFSPFVKLNIHREDIFSDARILDTGEEIERPISPYQNGVFMHLSPEMGFLFNKEKWFIGSKVAPICINSFRCGWKSTLQFGRLFNLSKDEKLGLGLLLDVTLYERRNPSVIFVSRSSRDNVLMTYLKYSKFTLGFSWSGRVGTNIIATYKHNDNWNFGISYNPDGDSPMLNLYKINIGVQYIFKKKEVDKLLSIPIK